MVDPLPDPSMFRITEAYAKFSNDNRPLVRGQSIAELFAESIKKETRQMADMRRGAEMKPTVAAEYSTVQLFTLWCCHSPHYPLTCCLP